MNLKKPLFLLPLAAVVAITALAGCGGNNLFGGKNDHLKVLMVTSPAEAQDGAFNQGSYTGVESFIKNNPGAELITVTEPDSANAVAAVGASLADNDVVVTPGYRFAGISSIAAANHSKKFILVDTYPLNPDEPSEITEMSNIYAMTFAEEEAGFFAGMAAALETKTGKVAAVSDMAYPTYVNYQYGFACGVKYVNATYKKDVECVEKPEYAGIDVIDANVGGNYIGSFGDIEGAKALSQALIDDGCDIIFAASGVSSNGTFEAAKKTANVKVIGCDTDRFDDGASGDRNVVLTSAVKVMHLAVERALTSVRDGSFKGGNMLLRANTNSVGFIKEKGRHQMSDETVKKLEEAYPLVASGELVPAANFNGVTVEGFMADSGSVE